MSEEIAGKTVELSDEEVEKAAGGVLADDDESYTCPNCQTVNTYNRGEMKPNCNCGYNPYTGTVNPRSNGGSQISIDIF